ncbi:hypothetical protein ANCDUO_05407 [Ancylostoma duodenale]|uniref:Uncharacterized protein n=1 Tax=Ancylostoma duodenale TaxID=51022 RepID=A0A0C2GSN1_9BILA|nr:hypothetical protein ANCDUO_05407 [Ancylostoma duodenale]
MELTIAKVFDTTFHYTYAMIKSLQTCCLLERLAATICFQSYEKNTSLYYLIPSQVFCVGFAFLEMVFLPMICFDTMISLVDIVSGYLQLDYVFEPERCAPEPYYLPVYALIVMVLRYDVMRNMRDASNLNRFSAGIWSGTG